MSRGLATDPGPSGRHGAGLGETGEELAGRDSNPNFQGQNLASYH